MPQSLVPLANGDNAVLTDLKAVRQQRNSSMPMFVGEIFHLYQAAQQFDWPFWLKPENLRDAQGRPPTAPDYNQGTLWIPSEEVQKKEGQGTPMLLQYWKVKAVHFDKITFFKVGKFYELFFYDAAIAQRECNLKWMSNEKKPHVGFPEMAKIDYAKILVSNGFKVVVVEQVERVAENKERVAADKSSSGPTCIERAACEVFTKGTTVQPEMLESASARYMLYLHFDDLSKDVKQPGKQEHCDFAACLIDCASSNIRVAHFSDFADRNALRTLLAQAQPGEVVYNSKNIPGEVMGMLRRLPCRPVMSPMHEDRSFAYARDKLEQYRKAHPGKIPDHVETVLKSEGAAMATAGALEYLEVVMLGQRVLPFAIWDVVASLFGSQNAGVETASDTAGKRLVLDATALAALEILETVEGTYKGSLLQFLDHTSTAFGFRLLKQWLCAPLYDPKEIRNRHQAVEYFLDRADFATQLRTGLKKINIDLERGTSRVWGYAQQSERHAVMYSDITAKRLGDFASLLQAFEQARVIMADFPKGSLPERLTRITRTKEGGGAFPDLQALIQRFLTSVVSTPVPNKNTVKYRPCRGADANFDRITGLIEKTHGSLEAELQRVRSANPGVAFAFVHRLPGFRFEIECEESSLPAGFQTQVDVTGRVGKSRLRFHTPRIKQLLQELDRLEDQQEDCVYPFLSRLFSEFYAHQAQFRTAIRLIAEVDALLSLAAASRGLAGTSCRPEIVDPRSQDSGGTLELRDCRHPVVAAKMGTSFVPNDAVLNAKGVAGILVVTGPNMGGKSTVLRQTCIAVIMAQLGCRVNAVSCILSPVDRIFTRIGSYDTILEGKSTLLTELEETAALLKHGTSQSLAVLDELGRGTSTFDGAAIAAAVLEDLAERVKCLALFATHYHPVSREAAKWPSVAPYHMAANIDQGTHEMTFLYRFLPGLCPASHGHNVARLAGLPASVLDVAVAKSAEFETCTRSLRDREDHSMEAEVLRLVQLGDLSQLRQLFRRHRAHAC